jgi:hypothetical protein
MIQRTDAMPSSIPPIPVELNLQLNIPVEDGLVAVTVLPLVAGLMRLRLKLLVSHPAELVATLTDPGHVRLLFGWRGEAQSVAAKEKAEAILSEDVRLLTTPRRKESA